MAIPNKTIKRIFVTLINFSVWGAIFVAISPQSIAQAEEISFVTEDLPPYSYVKDGLLTGASVETVRQMAKRLGLKDEIALYSWSIAYHMALSENGKAVFSTTHTAERDPLFKWVGPLIEDEMTLFARKGAGIKIKSLEDAKKVRSIGTYKDDMGQSYLKGLGFSNLDSVIVSRLNARKLAGGRIDLWLENFLVGRAIARSEKLEDKIERVFTVGKQKLYIGFNKDTPDDVIAKWQAALDSMKADGTYKAILERYDATLE